MEYPYPTYQTELEIEKLRKLVEDLLKEKESQNKLIEDQRRTIEAERAEKAELLKKFNNREFLHATEIENIYWTVPCDEYDEGIVITCPMIYVPKNIKQNLHIITVNHVYSRKYGIIRSLNEIGADYMKFGRFYEFKLNDERRSTRNRHSLNPPMMTHLEALRATKSRMIHQRRKTRIFEGKLVISVYFEFDASILYSSSPVMLEDKYLNRVHLRSSMIGQIMKIANNTRLKGVILVETQVVLKKNYLARFEQDPNVAIFEVEYIVDVTMRNQ